jgi:hypothetical protein
MPPALNALVMMVASVSLFYDVTVSLFTRKLSGESREILNHLLPYKTKINLTQANAMFYFKSWALPL